MLILNNIVHKTIWGGVKLTPFSSTKETNIGHLYSLISNGEFESKILNGKYKGQLFKKYFNENKSRFGLSVYKEFPLIIALVDATDDLSLQVHPNDETAKKLESTDFGKNESWYFIDAPKSGKIYNGCKAKNSQELKEKVIQNKYNDIIDYLDIKDGDYVYIKSGTMHAMTAGSLVYEIEENCNATYRVYDFDRTDKDGKKRPLHTQKALESINVNLKSKAIPFIGEKIERLYSTQLFKNIDVYTNNSKTLECLTVIEGESFVEGQKIQRGTTIILEPDEIVKLNYSDFVIARPLNKEEL